MSQLASGGPLNIPDLIAPEVLNNVSSLASRYQAGIPFPHIVIDDFFCNEIIEDIAANFPTMEQMPTVFREPMSYKGQLSDIDKKWPKFSPIFCALQSDAFRMLISRITGIPDLLQDRILAGAGLHQSPSSGFLDIHVDANFHPENKKLHRRVNILIYANSEWKKEWGGAASTMEGP